MEKHSKDIEVILNFLNNRKRTITSKADEVINKYFKKDKDASQIEKLRNDIEKVCSIDEQMLTQSQENISDEFKLDESSYFNYELAYKVSTEVIKNESLIKQSLMFKDLISQHKWIKKVEDIYFKKKAKALLGEYRKLFNIKNESFITGLYEKLGYIKSLKPKMLSRFQSTFGSLWSFSNAELKNMKPKELSKIFRDIKRYEWIKEVIKHVGSFDEESNNHSNKKDVPSVINTIGITQGSNITNVLPHQFAYRHHKKLSLLFKKDLIENKLLEFERVDWITQEDKIKKPSTKKNGPFIVCIDASGSMQGLPERIAKCCAMLIHNESLKAMRNVWFMYFTDRPWWANPDQEYKLELIKSREDTAGFMKFLTYISGGGTDIDRMIIPTLEMMKDKGIFNADIFFVSDFIADDFNDSSLKAINDSKVKGIRFHSLTIGSWYNESLVKFLDNNFIYDGTEESSNKILFDLKK